MGHGPRESGMLYGRVRLSTRFGGVATAGWGCCVDYPTSCGRVAPTSLRWVARCVRHTPVVECLPWRLTRQHSTSKGLLGRSGVLVGLRVRFRWRLACSAAGSPSGGIWPRAFVYPGCATTLRVTADQAARRWVGGNRVLGTTNRPRRDPAGRVSKSHERGHMLTNPAKSVPRRPEGWLSTQN